MKNLFLIIGIIILGQGIYGKVNPPKEDSVDILGIKHTPNFNVIVGILFILIGFFYEKIKTILNKI